MAPHLGNVPASSTLYIPFETVNGSGLGVTITGLAVTDIEVYKNGSTTQRASDNGYALLDTDGIDFDGVTGLHGISIDLSDNSDSGFYAAGAQYWVLINAVTLLGVAITPLVATFRIVAAESVAGKPKVDVDAFGGSAGTFAAGRPEVNASHWAGTATTLTSGLPDVNMKTITAGIIAAASFAANALDSVWSTATRVLTAGTNIQLPSNGLANVTAWTVALTGNITGNLSGSVGSVSGAVGSVTGAVGSVTGNVGGNVTGSVGSVATGGITAASFAADAITAAKIAADVTTELQAGLATAASIAALNNLSAAQVNAEADQALADAGVTTTVTGRIDAAISTRSTYAGADTAGTTTLLSRLTATRAGYLDNLSAGAVATAASIAALPQAVWDALTSALTTVGSIGKLLVTNIDAAITSRLSSGSYTAPDNASITAIKGVTDKVDNTLEDDSGTFRFTTNALEQAPTGGSAPTAAQVADEVQTRTIAAVTVVNGLAANSVTAAALAADAGTEIGTAVWATTARVLTANTNLNDLSAAGVRAALGLASANLDTQLDALPTNAELTAGFAAADDATLAALAILSSGISTSFTVLSAHGDSTWSTATGFATAANLATTDGKIDDIKDKTDLLGFSDSLVNANIAAVNGTQVQGTGETGDEWGPA